MFQKSDNKIFAAEIKDLKVLLCIYEIAGVGTLIIIQFQIKYLPLLMFQFVL